MTEAHKLVYQTIEVSDHIHFVQVALLAEISTSSAHADAHVKILSSLAYFMEILSGSTLAELRHIVSMAAVVYDKFRRRYPFHNSPIRAIKQSGER